MDTFEHNTSYHPFDLKPPVGVLYEPLLTKRCPDCSVEFQTTSKIKYRCNDCQGLADKRSMQRQNVKRRKRRLAVEQPGQPASVLTRSLLLRGRAKRFGR